MDKSEAAIVRAEEASRILNSGVFTAAFDDVKAALLATWAALPTSDTDMARDIHRRLKCLEDVKTALLEHVKSGKIAQKSIEGKSRFDLVRNAFRG